VLLLLLQLPLLPPVTIDMSPFEQRRFVCDAIAIAIAIAIALSISSCSSGRGCDGRGSSGSCSDCGTQCGCIVAS
jgi:hypothetical protein